MTDEHANMIRFSFDRAWDIAFLIDGPGINQDVRNKLERVKETMWNHFIDDANAEVEKLLELEYGSMKEAHTEGYADGIKAAINHLEYLRR